MLDMQLFEIEVYKPDSAFKGSLDGSPLGSLAGSPEGSEGSDEG